MSYQGPSENVQSHGQAQSGNEQVQSGSERAESHGQVQFGGGQVQSSSTSMAVQMIKNINKPRGEIKPLDKEEQKRGTEKSIESIRRFKRVNEEIKESYDKQDAKLKQREVDMHESLRKAEAKYFPDLDQSKNLDQSKKSDQSKDSDLDTDSSDDFVYDQKSKTNKSKTNRL